MKDLDIDEFLKTGTRADCWKAAWDIQQAKIDVKEKEWDDIKFSTLEWFSARVGDNIKQDEYEMFIVELAHTLGFENLKTIEDVCLYLYK